MYNNVKLVKNCTLTWTIFHLSLLIKIDIWLDYFSKYKAFDCHMHLRGCIRPFKPMTLSLAFRKQINLRDIKNYTNITYFTTILRTNDIWMPDLMPPKNLGEEVQHAIKYKTNSFLKFDNNIYSALSILLSLFSLNIF